MRKPEVKLKWLSTACLIFFSLALPGCKFTGGLNEVPAGLLLPDQPSNTNETTDSSERGFFLGEGLKDNNQCLVSEVVAQKKKLRDAYLKVTEITLSMIRENLETIEVSYPVAYYFSVYQFYSQMQSYLKELPVQLTNTKIEKIRMSVQETKAWTPNGMHPLRNPPEEIVLEFTPGLGSLSAIPAFCFSKTLNFSEPEGPELMTARWTFKASSEAVAEIAGLAND